MEPVVSPRKRKPGNVLDVLFIPKHISSPIKRPRPSVMRTHEMAEQSAPAPLDNDARTRNRLLGMLPDPPPPEKTYWRLQNRCTMPAVDLYQWEERHAIKKGPADPDDIIVSVKGTTGIVVLSALNTVNCMSLQIGYHGWIYSASQKCAELAKLKEVYLFKRIGPNQDPRESMLYLGVYRFHDHRIKLSVEGYSRLGTALRQHAIDCRVREYAEKWSSCPDKLAAVPNFDAQYRSGALAFSLLTVEWLRVDTHFTSKLVSNQNRVPLLPAPVVERDMTAVAEQCRAELAAQGLSTPTRTIPPTPRRPPRNLDSRAIDFYKNRGPFQR